MRDPAAYTELLTDVLRSKTKLFGEVALRRARAIPGLELDDAGKVVRLAGDPLAILEATLDSFERLSGPASSVSVQSAVRRLRLLERFPGLELPPRLRQGL